MGYRQTVTSSSTADVQDPRVVRTRRLLLDTARALILQTRAAPTLTDVARRAGVSRQAAYSNFGDLHGLLLALVVDALGLGGVLAVRGGRIEPRTEVPQGDAEESRNRLESLATAIQADRDLFVCLAELESRGAMSEVVAEFCRTAVLAGGWRAPSTDPDAQRADLEFATGGVRGLFEAWIRAPRGRGPAVLTRELLERLDALGWRGVEGAA
jgi:AcrR family transcriptional regulator